MRPCDKCGAPISNSTRLCGVCERMDGPREEASPNKALHSTENGRGAETAYVLSFLLFSGFGSLIASSAFGLLAFTTLWLACGLSISMSASIGAAVGGCVFALVLFAALTQGG